MALAAVALLAAAGCGSSTAASGTGGGDGTQFVQGNGAITAVAVGDRKAAPDISGTTLTGEKLSLSDYRGKVVVLNVWGSWCSPCRAEAPGLEKVYESTKAKGVQFLGINTRDPDEAPALAFERSFEITYPSLYDPAGKLILKFPKGSLMPQAIPSTLVIDRRGRIAVRALTALTAEELRSALDPVIAEKA